jgi:hypothetical protein
MRENGVGRIELPLPPLPLPTDRYNVVQLLDMTTIGPLSVLYFVDIRRPAVVDGLPVLLPLDHGLFVVQVNDVGGLLTADPPVRLSLPSSVGEGGVVVDPNRSIRGAFSPAVDRLGLVANNETTSLLMTAKVDRAPGSQSITSLSDLVVVGDLGLAGDFDYSPVGNSIVASIDSDLWMIHLDADNTYLIAELLTESTDGFAEWNPSFSPDGSHIAYSGGAISRRTGGVQDPDIYTLALAPRTVARVTNKKNKGAAAQLRNNAMWSADMAWIGFSAYTASSPPNSSCNSFNSEIFRIPADGSSKATKITDTYGTSAEVWPVWGW